MSLTYAQLIDGSVVSVSFGAGTQSAPSLYYSVDTTTGIFFPGTGTLALTTSGSERVRVLSTGFIGIGTQTPGTLLEVVGAVTGQSFIPSSSTIPTNGIYLPATNNVGIATNSFNRVTIDASGNVTVATGTVTGQSFIPSSNTVPTNGLYLPSANNVGIATNSLNRVTIDASGNITVATGTVTGQSFIPTSSTVPTNGIYLPAANSVGIATNSANRITVDSAGNVGIGLAGSTATAFLHLAAGGTAASTSPLKLTSGSVLTTPEAGATEYDGSALYFTSTTATGRGQVIAQQVFRLTSNGSAVGPAIADYFGATSSINLAANSVYEVEYCLYFTKTTAGTATFTLTASSAPTAMFGYYIGSPATGVGSGAPQTGYSASQAATTAALPATASLTTAVNHEYNIRTRIITNAATTFKVQITSSAGTATPLAGSFYRVRRVSSTTGTFS